MITILVSNKTVIQGLDNEALAVLKKTLTLVNPMFHKMLAMKRSVWGVPKEYKYYKMVDGGGCEVPRGFFGRIKEYLDKKGLAYEVIDLRVSEKIRGVSLKSIDLRDYQIPLVEQCVALEQATLVAGTGTGKTVMACEIIRRLGLKATFLVHNNVLLTQFKKTCESLLGFVPGVVNGDTKEIKDITVATFQTLANSPELLGQLTSQTGTLIVDECAMQITDKRLKVIASFMPKHIYGLTATPQRSESDGRTKAIHFIFGNVGAKHEGTQCTPSVKFVNSGVEIPADEYYLMVENMVNNASRNKLIVGLVLGEVLQGRKVLVLTKRIKHYELFKEMLPENDLFHYISSEDKGRNELLTRLKDGEEDFQCVFGTTSLLAVGTDIPQLDTLILACDMKEDTLTTQSVGRILRMFEGKPEPKIIDIWDKAFWNQKKARERLYKSKGWEINY